MKRSSTLLVALALLTGLMTAQDASAQALTTYRVTITNLTRSQIFSPPLVVSHTDDIALFRAGLPVIPQLATLAEDGTPTDLADYLGELSEVYDVGVADGMVPPGASITVEVDAVFPHSYLSAVGMLVTTNDAFFGLDSLRVPLGRRVEMATVPAYDAGSEANNEDCDFIPGPPCMNAFVRATDGAEGFVHIHPGIHGTGSLDAAEWDWRNPVAHIRVVRAE